jgi:hypothetical protein
LWNLIRRRLPAQDRVIDVGAVSNRPARGHAAIGTFAVNGPTRCGGLDVCRHDAAGLARELGPRFALCEEARHVHTKLNPA